MIWIYPGLWFIYKKSRIIRRNRKRWDTDRIRRLGINRRERVYRIVGKMVDSGPRRRIREICIHLLVLLFLIL